MRAHLAMCLCAYIWYMRGTVPYALHHAVFAIWLVHLCGECCCLLVCGARWECLNKRRCLIWHIYVYALRLNARACVQCTLIMMQHDACLHDVYNNRKVRVDAVWCIWAICGNNVGQMRRMQASAWTTHTRCVWHEHDMSEHWAQ